MMVDLLASVYVNAANKLEIFSVEEEEMISGCIEGSC